jgi:hypothetical protein
MPSTKDTFLGIHPTCHCGGDEAWAIWGRGRIGMYNGLRPRSISRNPMAFIWKWIGANVRTGSKTPIYPRLHIVEYEGEPHAVINFRA